MQPTNQQQIEALDESIIHHMDGVMCTEENYLKFNNSTDACALCTLFRPNCEDVCNGCPLGKTPCCVEYKRSSNGIAEDNFSEFHAGEVDLVNRLKREREKLAGTKTAKKDNRKGEEIELGYSWIVKDKLKLPEEGKALFKFVGEYRMPKKGEYYLWQGGINDKAFFFDDVSGSYEILEFVRPVRQYNVGDTFTLTEDECCINIKKDWSGIELVVDRLSKHVNQGEMFIRKDGLLDSSSIHSKEGFNIGGEAPIIRKVKKGYEIGDEFVYHNKKTYATAKVWDGMLCKIDRIDVIRRKYEMRILPDTRIDDLVLEGSGYPDGFKWLTKEDEISTSIVRCIDPRFWTVEKNGVAYRAYYNRDGKIRIYWKRTNKQEWFLLSLHDDVPEEYSKILEQTMPVMPYNYICEDYKYEYPALSGKE